MTALVQVKIWQVFSAGQNAAYIKLGPAKKIEFFTNGEPATSAEVNEEVKRLLPDMDELAGMSGKEAQLELRNLLGYFLTVIEKSGVELL